MKIQLIALASTLAVATSAAGKRTICADDPNYVSSLGLSCEHHSQVDCHAFAYVGMPLQEVDELLKRCPSSCRVDGCSTNESAGSLRNSNKAPLPMASLSLDGKFDREANIADSADVLSRSLEGDTCFDGKCKDDPLFRSKFFLPCESHVSFDCGVLQAVGFSPSEVTDLVRSCPCSCKQECPGPSLPDTESIAVQTPAPAPVSTAPTPSPTKEPTSPHPTSQPSRSPTTKAPTSSPTRRPTSSPTVTPGEPTSSPTLRPSLSPVTTHPSLSPVTTQPSLSPVTTRPSQDEVAADAIGVEELDSVKPQQHPGEVWENPQHPGEVLENEAINYYDPIGDQTQFALPPTEPANDILHNDSGETLAHTKTVQDSEDGGYVPPAQIAAAETYQDAGNNASSSWFQENAMYIACAVAGIVGIVAIARFVKYRARKQMEAQIVSQLALEYKYGDGAGVRGAQPNDNKAELGGGFSATSWVDEEYGEDDQERNDDDRYSERSPSKDRAKRSKSRSKSRK